MSGDLNRDVTPFSKEAQLARGPKKYRRTTASPKRWSQIAASKEGPCRVCNAPAAQTTFHHVVPRGLYHGSDTESNIVALCGTGTTGCHGKVEGRDRAACRTLVERLTDDEYAYAVEHGGENFFERRYGIQYQSATTAPRSGAQTSGNAPGSLSSESRVRVSGGAEA